MSSNSGLTEREMENVLAAYGEAILGEQGLPLILDDCHPTFRNPLNARSISSIPKPMRR
jgi:hypothetical protein